MKKFGNICLSILPLILSIVLQFVLLFPAVGLILMVFFTQNIFTNGQKDLFSSMESLFLGEPLGILISLLFAICGIVIYGFWFAFLKKSEEKLSLKKILKPSILVGLILLVPALQIVSSLITTALATIFPSWMEAYETLMEVAGFEHPSFFLLLYAVLLGPIEEELTFRGVSLAYGKKVLPFWAANILQATLFGIFHLNMIQGIYAFFIGLVLGYIYHKSGSLLLSIFLHVLFNFWGTFASSFYEVNTNGNETILTILMIGGSFLLFLIGSILFHKGIQRKEQDLLNLASSE